jgi:signal transduction histidine kinase
MGVSMVRNRATTRHDGGMTNRRIRQFLGRGDGSITWPPRVVLHSAFLLTDFPVAVVSFSVIVTGLALSVGLLVTVALAIPAVWGTLAFSRAIGHVERSRFAAVLDVSIPEPAEPNLTGGFPSRLVQRVRRIETWRLLSYHLMSLPVSVVTFTFTLTLWCLPLWLLFGPFITFVVPDQRFAFEWVTMILGPIGAIVLSVLMPRLIRPMVDMRVVLARWALGPNQTRELSQRVTTLETSRSALVEAVDGERRRIERDLHDGAQQRLVAVAMDLGMAKAKLDNHSGVSSEVRELIDSAHAESKRAIAELRDVARGVHPAILEDRGLDAALSSLAARCPVSVRINVDMPMRPDRATEAVAYYVVAEALTNVAKHAKATKVMVQVQQSRGRIGVEVTDDGKGGAIIGAPGGLGGGLAGLRDRVGAVDGTLTVVSPIGGPTTLLVELPCE